MQSLELLRSKRCIFDKSQTLTKVFDMLESIDEAGLGTEARFLESKLRLSIYLSKIINMLLIALSSRRKDENSKADNALEVENHLKSSFKCEVAAFR